MLVVCLSLFKKETSRVSMREKTELVREKAKDFNQMLWFDVGWQPVSMYSCCSYVVRAAPSTLHTLTPTPLHPLPIHFHPFYFVITADPESSFYT